MPDDIQKAFVLSRDMPADQYAAVRERQRSVLDGIRTELVQDQSEVCYGLGGKDEILALERYASAYMSTPAVKSPDNPLSIFLSS
jgi:hypothetical protein